MVGATLTVLIVIAVLVALGRGLLAFAELFDRDVQRRKRRERQQEQKKQEREKEARKRLQARKMRAFQAVFERPKLNERSKLNRIVVASDRKRTLFRRLQAKNRRLQAKTSWKRLRWWVWIIGLTGWLAAFAAINGGAGGGWLVYWDYFSIWPKAFIWALMVVPVLMPALMPVLNGVRKWSIREYGICVVAAVVFLFMALF